MTVNNLKIEYISISELKPAEYNPRQASEIEYNNLKNSLQNYGIVDPAIVNSAPNRHNIIIGGHFRLRIAKDLGYKEAPVVYVNIPEIEREKELNLRLNRNLGEWDMDLLANFDEDMLKDVGFTSEELDKIFQLDMEPDADEVPEVRDEVGVKVGDLYQLGTHRLLCGDSTQKEAVERLMAGNKADMVFTDPPYGINLDTDYTKIMNRGKEYSKVVGDDVEWDFAKANWFDCVEQFWFGAENYRRTIPAGGSWFVWNKQISEHDGASHTGSLFELCWSKTQHKREIINAPYFRFYGMDTKTRLHPTQKPIKLIEWFVDKFSKRDMLLVDLFLGSGSTLIACERLNRKCYGMEIDPRYVDVIIRRWQDYTGKKVEKLNV